MHTGIGWGSLSEGDHFAELGVDWRIILKWMIKKWDGVWNYVPQAREIWHVWERRGKYRVLAVKPEKMSLF